MNELFSKAESKTKPGFRKFLIDLDKLTKKEVRDSKSIRYTGLLKTKLNVVINKLFESKVKDVNTLLVKGKTKRRGQRIGQRSDWKKAYVTLKEGYRLDFINDAK
ncbi:50S ribosomal protein L23 [Candidatus Fukatsuia anoeciicola]|uniref:50S ribosomal protein L23 n=1 Tax=Candidatus Fukatsuia anoeciicola TaxID=2994492 RepID=UPI003463BA9A